jgi:transposase InsO family protein
MSRGIADTFRWAVDDWFMAGKVTAMDVKMLIATLPDDVKLAPWCRRLGISRQTAYKWRARYRLEGPAGLEDLSRAARRPAGRISAELEDRIVALCKWLDEAGLDDGPASIYGWLHEHHVEGVPSESTIWRVLVRCGQIVPQPQKRPKVTYCRFERDRPNELWQIDATHSTLATGVVVEVINLLDDRSRVCVDSLAVTVCTSPSAWKAFSRAAARYGLPAELLSDNGAAFRSYANGAQPPVFERNLDALRIRTLHSRPHHPETCGKVERFHKTQQRWLAKQPVPNTIDELQHLVDQFRDIYNHHRPHRGIGRRRPADVWTALPKAHPVRDATEPETLVRTHQVWSAGAITLARDCIVMLGRAHAGKQVTTIRRGNHLTVIASDTAEILRDFTIDPTRTHQTRGLRPSTTRP